METMEKTKRPKSQFFTCFKRKADGVDGPVIRACVYDGTNRGGIERLCGGGGRDIFGGNTVEVGDYIVEEPYGNPYTITVVKPDKFKAEHFEFDAAGMLSGGTCLPDEGTVITLTPKHSWWDEIGKNLKEEDGVKLRAAVGDSGTVRISIHKGKVSAEVPGKDIDLTYLYKSKHKQVK